MKTTGKGVIVAVLICLAVFGVVAPTFAASRSGTMTNWHDGDASSSWADPGKNGNTTSVTFTKGCKHDLDARIRKENFGPDTTMASERINCTSYSDAVVGGNYEKDNYHFDVHEYDLAGSYIVYPNLSGRYVIKW